MSMLTLTGVLVNTYTNPARKMRDGSLSDEKDKIQLLADIQLQNGQTRKELVSLTVPDATKYEGQEGVELRLPVGVMAPQKDKIIYYVPKA